MTSLLPERDSRAFDAAAWHLRDFSDAFAALGRRSRSLTASEDATANTMITAAMVGYAALVGILCRAFGRDMDFRPDLYVVPFYLSYLIFALTILIILAVRQAQGRTQAQLLGFSGGWQPGDFLARFLSTLPFLLAFPLFMAGFTGMKTLLNDIVPFTWDAEFAALGKSLHFGHHAWEWLGIRSPLVTHLLEFLYAFWGVLLVAVPFAVALRRPDCPTRSRFLVSYILILILLGNVAAGAFMSAGPFSFEFAGAHDHGYDRLFAYLSQADPDGSFSAINFQRYLWTAHLAGVAYIGTGISAFPSIHVAIAMLYTLFAWQFGRVARVASLLFLAAIMVGSVHLGWHYAVDGYAGCLGAAAIYAAVGWAQRRLGQPAAQKRRASALAT